MHIGLNGNDKDNVSNNANTQQKASKYLSTGCVLFFFFCLFSAYLN